MPGPPSSATLTKLRSFLRNGRNDYDWIASRIYAACYNDPEIMQKILNANPEDVPSPAAASEASSDGEFEDDVESDLDADEAEETAEPSVRNGSKENPVLLEGDETEDGAKESSSSKRKRPSSGVEESTTKKRNKSDELLLCVNCGSRFDPDKNKDGKCKYHSGETFLGELEDNPTNDDIEDDEESRETWPNAFQWDCCDANFEETDETCCKTGRHRSAEGEQTEYSRRRERERRRSRYYG